MYAVYEKPVSTEGLEISPELMMKSVKEVMDFIHAGKAIFTIRSVQTGKRYTFKVAKSKPSKFYPPCWWVKVLYGPDNNAHYRQIGRIFNPNKSDQLAFGFTHATVDELRQCQQAQAFIWLYGHLLKGELPSSVEFFRSRHCAHCAKLLTVPESIESCYGPVCRKKYGL